MDAQFNASSGSLDGAAQRCRDEEIADELRLLRDLVEHNPNVTFVKDWHGRYVVVNRAMAEFAGRPPQEIIGLTHRELTGKLDEAERLLRMDRHVIDTGEELVTEEKVTRPNGEARWYQTTKRALVRKNGEVQVVGFAVDITERKRAQENLERSARELQEMAAAARREVDEKSTLAAELDRRLAVIHAQHQQILALSTPILEVADGVMGVPLIGTMDDERAARLTERLLDCISSRQVRSVVLDLSALDVVDERAVDQLVGIVRAIRLLGARAAITGIQPALARTMCSLGIDLSTLTTMSTPKDAIRRFAAQG